MWAVPEYKPADCNCGIYRRVVGAIGLCLLIASHQSYINNMANGIYAGACDACINRVRIQWWDIAADLQRRGNLGEIGKENPKKFTIAHPRMGHPPPPP